MSQQFKFSKGFQTKILALMMHDRPFTEYMHKLVLPDYFTDPILAWYFCAIRNYYMDFEGVLPSTEAIKNEIRKAMDRGKIKVAESTFYLGVIGQISNPPEDAAYIHKEVSVFCKHQAIRNACLNTPALLAKEDFTALEAAMLEAFKVGIGTGSLGTKYFDDWKGRLKVKYEHKNKTIIPTGITGLDGYLNGGLRKGQLGFWQAPTARGKSLALMQCAKRAIIGRQKVIYFSMELSETEIAERFDSSFSKIKVFAINQEEYALSQRMETLGKTFRNQLIIKDYPAKQASINTLRLHVNKCINDGFKPDLILVDYLDLLKPTSHRKERREETTDLAEELRGFGSEFDVAVWTASQARRAAISAEINTEEDIADDIGKANTADVLITLNQNKEEVNENIMRLFVAKNRNGPKYRTVTIKIDFERMSFFDAAKSEGEI